MKTSIPVRVGDQVRVQGPTGFGHGKIVGVTSSSQQYISVAMHRYNGDLTDLEENRLLVGPEGITHVLETVTRWVKR